jgi:hypothetical protein
LPIGLGISVGNILLFGFFWYHNMTSYTNYKYLFSCFLSSYLLVCRYFDPPKWDQIKKKHLHSRHLIPSYFVVYGSEGVCSMTIYEHSREIEISETNLLIVGLVGETVTLVRDPFSEVFHQRHGCRTANLVSSVSNIRLHTEDT